MDKEIDEEAGKETREQKKQGWEKETRMETRKTRKRGVKNGKKLEYGLGQVELGSVVEV